MLIEDLIGSQSAIGASELHIIATHCSQFLGESGGQPLFKALPASYGDFHKVKVRTQKRVDDVAEAYNRAFSQQYANIRQRSVLAYPSAINITEGFDPFYIFPINGYSYMYSREVADSSANYSHVKGTLSEQLDETSTSDIVVDLLKYTYCTKNLAEGISSNSEIIVYGIPYYFAVRTSAVRSYSKITSHNK